MHEIKTDTPPNPSTSTDKLPTTTKTIESHGGGRHEHGHLPPKPSKAFKTRLDADSPLQTRGVSNMKTEADQTRSYPIVSNEL